jgi:hypothetical protein
VLKTEESRRDLHTKKMSIKSTLKPERSQSLVRSVTRKKAEKYVGNLYKSKL